ncbi:outer membrane beta-barrel protein [Chitinophaga pinensis]|uniref:Outer membrane receptor for ferrienterochelin and colicin n=1 Tax=Chitinophaga pinensis (strain ATCC 43595 / DSM 2588 / LMG 13176 / NBRC 15968 / NCIMB 11800 / UQM 2034) TaxID=485918 RepID=A0A979GQJ0_CHIPD|nr:outer membrane beta-barrel protein [Chitinophaga pinensis]ACU60108.1 outer membrane receptor for ferrienterochelin and colicin [Chitinophaga pinensis DSM 2588]
MYKLLLYLACSIPLLHVSLTSQAQTADTLRSRGLKTVTVTGQKPLIRQEVDRLIYDLQADPDSKGSNLLEIMRKVPFLSVDASGNLLLKGNSSYKVLINGKESGMFERDPAMVLRTIPASTIQHIEVITTPPSKYDGEGLTGIINIVTIRRKADGYNGTINISERFPANGPGAGGSFAMKEGNLGISVYGGAGYDRRPHARNDMQRTAYAKVPITLLQEGDRHNHRSNGYFGTELSYAVDTLHLLTAQFNFNAYGGAGEDQLLSRMISGGNVNQQYAMHSSNNNHGNGMDAGINYQITSPEHKNNLITFSYRYATNGRKQAYEQQFTATINYDISGYLQDNDEQFREHTLQADYVRTFRYFSMEAGVKGIWRSNYSDYLNAYLSADPVSNGFDGQQRVFSVYNAYTFSSKHWDLKAGLRAEQTFMEASWQSDSVRLHKQFLNLIPSVVINRKLGNNSSLNLGISRRLKRPNIYKLNPFKDRSNPSQESSGNPALRPTLTTNVQLGYSWSGNLSFNAAVSYAFLNNMFMEITSYDTARNITTTSIENNVRGSGLGFDYTINYPVTKWLNLGINGNAVYLSLDGASNAAPIALHRWNYAINGNASVRLNKGWKLNTSLNITGRNQASLQATNNAVTAITIGGSKDLIKDKLTCSAGISNPFQAYRQNRTALSDKLFTQYNNTQEYFRTVNVSINYNFGRLKQAIQKNRRGIRNDDGN